MIYNKMIHPVFRLESAMQKRCLSSQTAVAVQKLRTVLEEYRKQNYNREIPSRFKKDIVLAAQKTKRPRSNIIADDMERILINIGMSSKISKEEVVTIFKEVGNEAGEMTPQKLLQLL